MKQLMVWARAPRTVFHKQTKNLNHLMNMNVIIRRSSTLKGDEENNILYMETKEQQVNEICVKYCVLENSKD